MTPQANHLILMIQPQTNIEGTSRTNMESKPFSSTTGQPDVESSTWVIVAGRHHMKYSTVESLASNFHLLNNHGWGFVGRVEHGQRNNTKQSWFLLFILT